VNAIYVRAAVPTDAEAILHVHNAAVHKTAGAYYPPEVLEAWAAKLTEENHQRVGRETADEEMIVLVAEVDARLAGFGMVVPGDEELRAVYVHPAYGRRGVGTAILKRLEEFAAQRGVKRLNVASSINAEEFYARQGYEVVERTVHQLRSGQEMACVKMMKLLHRRHYGIE
jgi:putative acetyltransferase